MYRQKLGAVLFIACASLMLGACQQPEPPMEDELVTATREETESRVSEMLDSELRGFEVSSSEVDSDGLFGRVEAQIVLDVCPYFLYDLSYNAQRADEKWVLYNDAESLPNLAKRWAMAQSAALAGETVDVPGSQGQRQVTLIPHNMPELLQARLDGLSNATVDPLAGFFVCLEDEILWEEMDPELAEDLQELIPQVRDAMEATVAQQIAEP